MKKRMRLLQEEKELRMSHQHIIKFERSTENEQEDDMDYMANVSPDTCTEYVADVIRPVEQAEAVGDTGTDRNLTLDDVDVLTDKIKVIVNRHKLSQSCVNDVLSTLKGWFPTLPVNVRTVMGTDTEFKLVKLCGGDYIHISLMVALNCALKHIGASADTLKQSELKIQLNIDGIPMCHSNNYTVWPILAKLMEPVKTAVFVIGVYGGKKKPANFNVYLRMLVDEMKVINEEGGVFCSITNSRLPISILNICCDAAARGSVRCVHAFNFRYGCDRCKVRGHHNDRRMTFMDNDAELRQDSDFEQHLDKGDEDEYRTDDSILREVGVGMVSQFPYDYMHLVCLGIGRSLATMLHKPKQKGSLTAEVLHEVCEHMVLCASRIPKEFQRRCRTLYESSRWKATESRQFVLYTGPVVLRQSSVPRKQYENFLYLSVAIRCLCSKDLIDNYLDFAQDSLEYFVQGFGEVYGEKFVVYNVHSMLHLADDARKYGVLDNFSCFEYESFLGVMKELTHKRKTSHYVQQICRRVSERDYVITPYTGRMCDKQHGSVSKLHRRGPTLSENDSYKQYKELIWNGQFISLKDSDNCLLCDGQVCIVRNILQTVADKTVVILRNVFEVQTDFFTLPLKITPDFKGTPLQSGNVGIWKVRKLSTALNSAYLDSFNEVIKCVLLPTGAEDTFVAIKMIHNL